MEALQYPIGRFNPPATITDAQLKKYIDDIRYLPQLVELAVQNMDEYQLQTPYRPDGWTVAQVVHHLADSHMNAVVRMKLALTENNPVIKPYDEQAWATLPDVANTPVNVSITLLYALHNRWVALLEHLQAGDWNKTFYHPGSGVTNDMRLLAATYSWHGLHHLEHILRLKERMGW
jgi:hypothetical protein